MFVTLGNNQLFFATYPKRLGRLGIRYSTVRSINSFTLYMIIRQQFISLYINTLNIHVLTVCDLYNNMSFVEIKKWLN